MIQAGPVIAVAKFPCAVGAHSTTHLAPLPKLKAMASTASTRRSQALELKPIGTFEARELRPWRQS